MPEQLEQNHGCRLSPSLNPLRAAIKAPSLVMYASATLQHPNDLLKSDASAVRSVFHKCILTDNLSALDEHHRNVVKLFSSVHVAVELIQETLLHLLHRKMLVVTEE